MLSTEEIKAKWLAGQSYAKARNDYVQRESTAKLFSAVNTVMIPPVNAESSAKTLNNLYIHLATAGNSPMQSRSINDRNTKNTGLSRYCPTG